MPSGFITNAGNGTFLNTCVSLAEELLLTEILSLLWGRTLWRWGFLLILSLSSSLELLENVSLEGTDKWSSRASCCENRFMMLWRNLISFENKTLLFLTQNNLYCVTMTLAFEETFLETLVPSKKHWFYMFVTTERNADFFMTWDQLPFIVDNAMLCCSPWNSNRTQEFFHFF